MIDRPVGTMLLTLRISSEINVYTSNLLLSYLPNQYEQLLEQDGYYRFPAVSTTQKS